MKRMLLAAPALCIALAACSDNTNTPVTPDASMLADRGRLPESNAAVYWNGVARGLVIKYKSSPFQSIRGYALLSVAQYHAATAVSGEGEHYGSDTRPSMRAAIGTASVTTLTYLFPAEASALGTLLDQQ
ncbi:MAG: hypothetical protein ACHQ2E_08185, partial [Gemmatimonadales bacterium]